MKRAHANASANRKKFMIRTSLRISMRRRNTTFSNVLAVNEKEANRRCLNEGNLTGKSMKIFIDLLIGRWLKVGSSGVKWAITPHDHGRRFPTRTLLCRRVPAFYRREESDHDPIPLATRSSRGFHSFA